MENDLKSLSFELATDLYKASNSLSGGIHHVIADELILSSFRTSFAANSAKSALSRDRFIRHLEEGYYASGRTYELLKLIKSADIPLDGIDNFLEDTEKIHRMFGASIKTIQRKNIEARV
ncbi:MAG: hypothetical protein J6U54_11960 [Clostridiales bacterium]|nr:hypothetical protein [Clostridiales bacterium]